MGSMPNYNVSKGPFTDLDARFDGTAATKQNYFDALTTLNDLNKDLLGMASTRYGPPATSTKTKHLQDDWLGSTGNPAKYNWSSLQPDDTLRWGLIKAISAAVNTDPPKPMQFFWVCANDHAFHVYFDDGPHQVTVLIFTPPPLNGAQQPSGGGFVDASTLKAGGHLSVVKMADTSDAGYPSPITVVSPQPTPPGKKDTIMRPIWEP